MKFLSLIFVSLLLVVNVANAEYGVSAIQYKKVVWDVAKGAGHDISTAAAGIVSIFTVPAETAILKVYANVETAVAGASAEEFGDGDDVDGWLTDGFAANAGVYPVASSTASYCGVYQCNSNVPLAGGKLYATADTLDFKLTGTATAGRIAFIIEFMKL